MAISLLEYVATLLGQLCFSRSYFFTLLQSKYLNTIVTFWSSYFFRAAAFLRSFFFKTIISSQQLFFQNSYCFREKLLPSSHFLRIDIYGSYFLEQYLQKNYLLEPSTAGQHQLLQKSYFLENDNYSGRQYSALPIFYGELPLQSGYFFK